ncbi:hypothetical protein K8I61_06235 [bacterium]|nr:hypothetical protein [bacterium]
MKNVHETIVIGRLEALDGHDGLTGRLVEPDGTTWRCVFKPEHEPRLGAAWLQTVRVTGEVREGMREKVIDVDVLVLKDDRVDRFGSSAFFENLSIEEIARRQGWQPRSIEEIQSHWPAPEDDPEEFRRYLAEDKRQQRELESQRRRS